MAPRNINPFRTASSLWGQITQISSSLSPKRGCGPKRVSSRLSDPPCVSCIMFHFSFFFVYCFYLFIFSGLACVVVFSYPVRLDFTCLTHEFAIILVLVFLRLTVCDHRIIRGIYFLSRIRNQLGHWVYWWSRVERTISCEDNTTNPAQLSTCVRADSSILLERFMPCGHKTTTQRY